MGQLPADPCALPPEQEQAQYMAQKHKHQVTRSVEGRVMPPQLTLAQPRQPRERVVQGTNEAVHPLFVREVVRFWLIFLMAVGVIVAALSWALGLPVLIVMSIYVVLSILISFAMWKQVLPYMTGDNVAEKEIAKERDVELAHIGAQREVALKYLDVAQNEIDTQRELEMARIQIQQDQLNISRRIARLEQAQLDSLHTLPAERTHTFVPAQDQSAKLKVHEWVNELYDTEGAITNSGKVRKKMPQWSKEEERYILELFVAPTRQGEWWEVIYQDKYEALTALHNMNRGGL